MPASTVTRGHLRRLAELRPERGWVLSVFLNLDPSQFATGPARSTAITSLMNDAARRVEATGKRDHAEHQALRADLERVRRVLEGPDLARGGTKSVAVFACGPADLLEVVRLAHPIKSRAVVDHTPWVAPLVSHGHAGRWAVLLTNRRCARILLGDGDGFEEVGRVDDDVRGQHDQGGLSQSRFERSVDEDKRHHLERAAEELFRTYRQQSFDHLLIGTPDELAGELKEHLHPYVRERVAGRLHVDVENTPADAVAEAAAPLIAEHQRARERGVLDRFLQEAGRGGRAAAGLAATLTAINEQRVEVLLFEDGFRAGGALEKRTGLLTVDGAAVPMDDPEFEGRGDILEQAIERAIEQSAEIMVVRRFPDLGAHGGIGALLRF